MSELRPIEIDVLEDLLEGLEDDGVPTTIDLDDPQARRIVGERLAEYREILQACREALPMEEVPAGVLDGVLEAARRPGSSPEAAARPGLWKRLRGTLVIPGLALAATTALIIVVLRPDAASEPDSSIIAAAERASAPAEDAAADDRVDGEAFDGRLADASLEPRARAELDARGGGVLEARDAREEEAAEPEPEPAGDRAEAQREQVVGGAPAKKRSTATGSTGSAKAPVDPAPAKNAPGPSAPPQQRKSSSSSPKPSSKAEVPGGAAQVQDPWAAIETGDAQRRSGKCSAARSSYQKALAAAKDTGDARAVARAHAGLGLCEAREGREAAAEGHFAKARKADAGIGRFIDGELAKASASKP